MTDRDLDALVERIAQRTAAIVLEQLDAPSAARRPRLVTAAELARILGIGRDSVYARADQLGAIRVGDGPRARLRFDVDQALAANRAAPPADPMPAPARRRARMPTGDLLPINDRRTTR